MSKVHIVVGTVMGTAAEVARTALQTLEAKGHEVSLTLDYQPGVWQENETLLVCTSNTGMGDLPANIEPLLTHLTQNPPRVPGWRYGIINLGDSSYPNFAQAGRTLDEALSDIGALRLGEPLVLDAILLTDTDYPEETRAWITNWSDLL